MLNDVIGKTYEDLKREAADTTRVRAENKTVTVIRVGIARLHSFGITPNDVRHSALRHSDTDLDQPTRRRVGDRRDGLILSFIARTALGVTTGHRRRADAFTG